MPNLCRALRSTAVFSHYAYGDPLPIYARYHGDDPGEERDAVKEDAIAVFVECARQAGHRGDHLALDGTRWPK